MQNATMQQVREALEYNARHGLYSDNPAYIRVYADYDGGPYDGQRTSIKTLAMLDKDTASFKNIEIVTTATAWGEYFNDMKAARG